MTAPFLGYLVQFGQRLFRPVQVICHFEEETRPKIIRLHFVREEVIAV